MAGRAERARRTRRLAVLVVAALAVATLFVLGWPLLRGQLRDHRPAPAPTLSPSPSETASTSIEEVGVSACGRTRPAVRPDQLSVTCSRAQPTVVITEVTWSSWGQLNAFGTALVVTNTCDPTCAEGSDNSYAVSVVLDQVVTTRGGTQFSRATVVWTASRPTRFPRPLQVDLPVFRG